MASKILLDSHILLWLLKEPGRLGPAAKETIESAQIIYISVASIWELNLKRSRGKLQDMPSLLSVSIRRSGFLPLNITVDHAEAIAKTPIPHKDPFDQLLLAQARMEGATLITADASLLECAGTLDARR